MEIKKIENGYTFIFESKKEEEQFIKCLPEVEKYCNAKFNIKL